MIKIVNENLIVLLKQYNQYLEKIQVSSAFFFFIYDEKLKMKF